MASAKKIALVIVAVAIIAGVGAYFVSPPGQVSATEIKDMALTNAENIDTCKFDMDMTMNMIVSNESGEFDTTMISNGSGVVDNVDKKMKMKMTTSMEMPEGMEKSEAMEMYFVNNTMYMRMDTGTPEMPTWTKMEMPEWYEGYWKSQNQVGQQMELLNISEVERLRDEKVNGVDCYVLKIKPDLEQYWKIMMEQKGVGELIKSLPQNMSLDLIQKMIKDMTIKQWIAKDTNFPMKTEMQMKMVISSEDLNITGMEEQFTMVMDQKTIMTFYDYNEPVSIELPEEAESAIEMPMTPPATATAT